MSATAPRSGQLATAVAIFVYLLNDAGNAPDDAEVAAACRALTDAGEGADFNALGQALVDCVEGKLTGGELADVQGFLAGLFGAERLSTSFGESREERLRGMRRYHFHNTTPWLARIIDRFPDGEIGPHWVLVERVDENVRCADPYPWDDLDEEYESPITDFMVKWELLGCEGVRLA
jgi:hypothetical protein